MDNGLLNRAIGKITFAQSLSSSTDVTFSVVRTSAYITDVGVTPHSEVLDAFVSSETVYTALAVDLEATDNNIKVLSTSGFTGEVLQILVGEERITVQRIDAYTFRTINQRSGSQTSTILPPRAWCSGSRILSSPRLLFCLAAIQGERIARGARLSCLCRQGGWELMSRDSRRA